MSVSGRRSNPLSVSAGPPLPLHTPCQQGAAPSMSTASMPSSDADATTKTCAGHNLHGDKQDSRQRYMVNVQHQLHTSLLTTIFAEFTRSESVAPLQATDPHSRSNNLGASATQSVDHHGDPTNDEETEYDIFAIPPTPNFRTPSPIGPPSPMIPWEQSLNDYLSDQPLVNNTYRGLTPFPDHNFDDDIFSAQSAANSEYCLDGSGNFTVDTVHGEPALKSPSSVASEHEHPSPRR